MIRGTKRELDKSPSAANLNLNASIHNRFDIEVVDAKTGEVKQKARAFNVICNQMWSRLLSNSMWNDCIHVGTGSGSPSASDTSLFSYLTYKSSTFVSYSNKPGVFSLTKRAQLLETECVGSTLTEVGIAYGSSKTALCTHAMLEDMNGNQVSILKTDTDIININATVFVHYDVNGYNGIKIQSSGNLVNSSFKYLYGFLCYLAAGYNTGSYGYGCATYPRYYACCSSQVPYYSSSNTFGLSWTSSLNATFDVDNKKIICTASRIPASSGNDKRNNYYLRVCTDSEYRYGLFDIPASVIFPDGISITGEAIGTGDGSTVDFTTYFPGLSDCTVYVDGVATDVMVDEHTPFVIDDHESCRLFKYLVKKPGETTYTEQASIVDTLSVPVGSEILMQNPYYKTIGIKQFKESFSGFELYASQDRNDWVQLTVKGNPYTVPEEYRHCEWFKIVSTTGDMLWMFHSSYSYGIVVDRDSNANIHFTTPPVEGAVITADYKTDVIAKDENHVFDFSIEITLGEYNPDT